jgi:hypothetical protein
MPPADKHRQLQTLNRQPSIPTVQYRTFPLFYEHFFNNAGTLIEKFCPDNQNIKKMACF